MQSEHMFLKMWTENKPIDNEKGVLEKDSWGKKGACVSFKMNYDIVKVYIIYIMT